MVPLRISVIVPVHNALPYLAQSLESLAAQDLPASQFEIIAVDDGSTDGSGAWLDQFAARHRHVRVIHEPPSGAPGPPRNAGLAVATGQYIFFADADDVVGNETLRRLADFADAHEADIVIPKLTPLGNRSLPESVYKKTVVDADLPTAFRTLFPQKLYRRGLLHAHQIRFQEGLRNFSDGLFNARAFVHARRISIVTGYDYYFLREREDGGNVSLEPLEPASYTRTVAAICGIVRDHVDADTAARVIADLYCRKCLNRYHRGRLSTYEPARREAWVAAHSAFAREFVTDAMERGLKSPYRERSELVRRGDTAALVALGEQELRQKHAGYPPVGSAEP